MGKKVATNIVNELVDESEIRSALLCNLAASNFGGAVVQEEFRIERGGARVDVAVIGSTLVGYEIKSDHDSFIRFPNQIHAYNRIFDEINLVCGPTHALLAEHVIPSWWGLWIAERDANDVIQLKQVRKAQSNLKQDPFSLASLLWRDEAASMLSSEMINVPLKASSHQLWEAISKSFSIVKIKEAVTESLLKRQNYNELAVSAM